jgi:hypothetical protein
MRSPWLTRRRICHPISLSNATWRAGSRHCPRSRCMTRNSIFLTLTNIDLEVCSIHLPMRSASSGLARTMSFRILLQRTHAACKWQGIPTTVVYMVALSFFFPFTRPLPRLDIHGTPWHAGSTRLLTYSFWTCLTENLVYDSWEQCESQHQPLLQSCCLRVCGN